MDNEVSRAYVENMPEPRIGFPAPIDDYLKCFWNSYQEQVSAVTKISRKPSLKINVSIYGETGVVKQPAKESKAVQEKIYTSTDKVWNVVSLAARNSPDEYKTKKSSL